MLTGDPLSETTLLKFVARDASKLTMRVIKRILVSEDLFNLEELEDPHEFGGLSKYDLIVAAIREKGSWNLLPALHKARKFSHETLIALAAEGIDLVESSNKSTREETLISDQEEKKHPGIPFSKRVKNISDGIAAFRKEYTGLFWLVAIIFAAPPVLWAIAQFLMSATATSNIPDLLEYLRKQDLPTMVPATATVPEITSTISAFPSSTITPTLSPSPTPTPGSTSEISAIYELIFREDFEVSTLDRNKWSSTCDPQTEAFLVDGELHFRFKPSEGLRTCTLKPQLDVSRDISLIRMKLKVSEKTNDFGWIGIFTDCGGTYFNFVANKYEFSLIRESQIGAFQRVEAINELPVTRIITIRKEEDNVILSTAEYYNETLHDLPTYCYDNFSDVRIGGEIDYLRGGQIEAVIDDVEIWALPAQ